MAEALGGIAGKLQGTVTGVISKGQNLLDKFMPPERRAELWAKFTKFCSEKPALASFLLSHIAISGLPLALFILMTITVAVFALVAALLVGLLGALLFIVFAVGVALLVLLPTLFFTTMAATFIWLWGTAAYYILKYFNQKEIPGIHTPLSLDSVLGKGGKSEGDKHDAANGDHAKPRKLEQSSNGTNDKHSNTNGEKKESKEHQAQPSAKDATDKVGKSTGVDVGNVGDVKKKADVGNATNKAGDVTKNVPGGDKVADATKNVPGVES